MQMFSDATRKKLENIVNGFVIEEQADSCTAIRNLLCTSFGTSRTVKKDFEGQSIIKEKQVAYLTALADDLHFRVTTLPAENQYLTRGGSEGLPCLLCATQMSEANLFSPFFIAQRTQRK